LDDNREVLTEKTIYLMPYMIKQNWLLSYQTVSGIDGILTQMDGRTKNKSKMRFASEELQDSYLEFEQEFTIFFEDLRAHVHQHLNAE
jgi:acyl carrier protein phosphodiesterase